MQRIQAEDEPDEVRLRSKIREISWLFGESTRNECRPAKAMRDMPEPTSAKEWKSFLGKASYLRRFLPGLAVGPSYGIAKEKGGVQMGRGPSTKPLRK